MTTSIKHVVEQFYEAWKTGDIRKFLFAPDFTFDGPIFSFASPEPCLEMARQNFPLVKDVKLLETIYSENKAFVMLEFVTNTPIGSWIAIDYFLVEDGRIKYSRTVYDPRKLIEFMQAQ